MRPPARVLGPTQETRSRAGFTLAEVAVTLLIVSMTLLLVLDGLASSKLTAAHGSNRKLALGLGLETLAWAESGLFWEELDGKPGSVSGNYAEEGYPAFIWELAVGEDELSTSDDPTDGAYFDSYAYQRQVERERDDGPDEQEPFAETGSTGAPYEIVTVRVTFPKLGDEENEVVLQRWIPLVQVYGQAEGDPGLFGEEPEG